MKKLIGIIVEVGKLIDILWCIVTAPVSATIWFILCFAGINGVKYPTAYAWVPCTGFARLQYNSFRENIDVKMISYGDIFKKR